MTAPATGRQVFALAHPLNTATGSLDAFTGTRPHRTGVLVQTILAVDR